MPRQPVRRSKRIGLGLELLEGCTSVAFTMVIAFVESQGHGIQDRSGVVICGSHMAATTTTTATHNTQQQRRQQRFTTNEFNHNQTNIFNTQQRQRRRQRHNHSCKSTSVSNDDDDDVDVFLCGEMVGSVGAPGFELLPGAFAALGFIINNIFAKFLDPAANCRYRQRIRVDTRWGSRVL